MGHAADDRHQQPGPRHRTQGFGGTRRGEQLAQLRPHALTRQAAQPRPPGDAGAQRFPGDLPFRPRSRQLLMNRWLQHAGAPRHLQLACHGGEAHGADRRARRLEGVCRADEGGRVIGFDGGAHALELFG